MLAARNEISATEKEKAEKGGLALKALQKQEAIMESIVQEAKKLKEESEENSKLRGFLDDCSWAVDSLEGEITVICKDVMALKRRVNEHGPLKGPLMVGPYGANSSQSSSVSDKSNADLATDVLPEEQQALSKRDSTLLAFSQELENISNAKTDITLVFPHELVNITITNSLSNFNSTTSWNEKSLSDEDEWEILRNEVGQF